MIKGGLEAECLIERKAGWPAICNPTLAQQKYRRKGQYDEGDDQPPIQAAAFGLRVNHSRKPVSGSKSIIAGR